MATAAPITTQSAIEGFRSKVRELTIKTVCNRSCIRVRALNKWMSKTIIDGLLHEIHPGGFSSIEPLNLIPDYSIVFAILLEIGLDDAATYTPKFTAASISNESLPLDLDTIRRQLHWPSSAASDDADFKRVTEKFHEKQWKFCAVRFKKNMNPHCRSQHILPICEKTSILNGAIADIWRILVPEDFVDPDLQKFIAGNRHAKFRHPIYGPVSI